jgi:hypothetical protein
MHRPLALLALPLLSPPLLADSSERLREVNPPPHTPAFALFAQATVTL